MTEDSKYEPPESSIKDHAHTLARAGIGSVPIIGAAGVELFQALITPPLEKRRQAWMEAVTEGLQRLENAELCNIDELSENEVFIDTVMYASQTVLRNNHKEKREALRNAVLNSALPNPPDESRQQMFIGWVDELTVWHLRILRFFADPVRWFQEQEREVPQYVFSSSLEQILTDAYPELAKERELCDQIGKDLYNRGLAGTDSLRVSMTANGAYQPRATELGKQFLQFITEPTI